MVVTFVKKETRFLITTALETTWVEDQQVLFLGDWCQLYSRRDKWMTMDGVVLPYHWADREKLHRDYQYLARLYERLLPVLAEKLNELHSVKHGLRYWRILVGPWLLRITHILFDRWETIQQALRLYEIAGTSVLPDSTADFIPSDMLDFVKLFQEDAWNHHIFSEILTNLGQSAQVIRQNDFAFAQTEVIQPDPVAKNFMYEIFEWVVKNSFEGDKFFFRDTYLRSVSLAQLSLSFFQIPQRKITARVPFTAPNLSLRTWQLRASPQKNFENFLLTVIPKQIPTLYLEGYSHLVERINALPWPKQPRLIFTSNALWYDDLVKAYAAQKIEDGSILVYGQHGGGYGIAKLNVDEEHEVCIADRYLSMGWVHNQNPKVVPMGHLGFKKIWSGPFNKKNDLLLVTLDASRYAFRACSESALNMTKYLKDNFSFVDLLNANVQRGVVVRLTKSEKGWFHATRWRDRFPKVKIDNGGQDIYRLMKNSRMVISTYNQTTILETLAFNIPSVLFCDLQQTPLRDTAVPFYAKLKQVGIFHDTPESAAKHINEVWSDVDSWWFSESVQNAVTEFTHHYCRRVPSIVSKIRTVFKEAIRKQHSIAG